MANGESKAQVIVDGVPVYTLRNKLGGGGMAQVYLAEPNLEVIVDRINKNLSDEAKKQVVIEQLSANPQCAIKICKPTIAQHETFLKRFFREGQQLMDLSHDNVVSVFDAGEARIGNQNYFYYTMELIDLIPDADKKFPNMDIPSILNIGIRSAAGLSYLHKNSIVHRDVKPDNILVSKDLSIVKISDVGIAKVLGEETHGLTMTGTILGTPKFMSPEQAKESKHIDYRTDIYSLGASIYTMLTGKDPFQATSALLLLDKVRTGVQEGLKNGNFVLPRTHNPEIALGLEAVLLRAMATNPEERYQKMEEFGSDLNIVLQRPDSVPKRAQDYVQISVVPEERKKLNIVDTGRNLPVKGRRTPPRGVVPVRQTRKREPVEDAKPFYKKPIVLGGIGAGVLALGLAGIIAMSGPKLPDSAQYKSKADAVQQLYGNGKYDEVLSNASKLDAEISDVLNKFPEQKFPQVKDFAAMKSELGKFVQKAKDCKEYVAAQSAYDSLFSELESKYDSSKHSELDAKSASLAALLEKAEVKEKDEKKKAIFAKKDSAVTLKNKCIYAGVEKQFGEVDKTYNAMKSEKYDKAKIDSLEATVRTIEQNLKPIDSKRVPVVDKLREQISAIYKGIETLKLKDPAKKFGVVAQLYGDAENALDFVKKQGDKRNAPEFYDKLKQARQTLEKIEEKTSSDYKSLDKNLGELNAHAKSLTDLMPELRLTFEHEADAAYFKGDAKVEKGQLNVSGKVECAKPFSQNSLSYDASGKFKMSIGSETFVFDSGKLHYGNLSLDYKDKGTIFIEYVSGKGLYVNGQLLAEKKNIEGKVILDGNVKLNDFKVW